MNWVLWALPLLVIGGCVVLAAGWGGGMRETYDDRPDVLVPSGRTLGGDDIRAVRFTSAFRGYRMAEVDALLDRLAAELDERASASAYDGRPEAPDVTGDDSAG